ncbi:hypothetical protein F4808DRAFT_176002 [Astrocystis sublimbata]|nr:hypothetical protein F4808DRAFT_176002 [Astrocystis sublimbata]
MKNSLQQFLESITASVKPKDLAYHLFLTVTLYVSKKVSLDEEQMSVMFRTAQQLQQEWGAEAISAKPADTPSCTGPTFNNDPTMTTALSVDTPPLTEQENSVTSPASIVAIACEGIGSLDLGRSTTPDGFVREAEKHTPADVDFHGCSETIGKADLGARYPFGHKVLSSQGWSDPKGLGPDESGIQRPIDIYAQARNLLGNQCTVGSESPPKSGSHAPTKGVSAKEVDTQINETPATAALSPWRRYALNPQAGDDSAKKAYRDKVGTVQKDGRTHGPLVHTNGNESYGETKITVQNQCIINDTWRDTSKRKSTRLARNRTSPQETSRETAEAPSDHLEVWKPFTGTSKGW